MGVWAEMLGVGGVGADVFSGGEGAGEDSL